MFIPNKYTKWYFSIVNNATSSKRSPAEKHHIIPKSMGGSNQKTNLALLSPREHCLCHLLLTKMTSGNHRYKMVFAALMMTEMKSKNHSRTYRINSRIYEALRRQRSLAISNAKRGIPMSEEQKEKLSISVSGFKHTQEAKEAISKNHRCHQTEETSQKISASKKGIATRGSGWATPDSTREKQKLSNLGKKRSEEARQNISKSQLGTKIVNNGYINKKIPKEEFIYYCENGWLPGRVKSPVS
jgi:hypothetical protein